MKSLQSYKKFIPYSDRVFSSVEWCHWFLLFNVFISILISIRYNLNINYNFSQFGYIYQILNLFGHLWFINFVFFLFVMFPSAFIITNSKTYKVFCVILEILVQTSLLIDTQIFHYFKFHINPTLLQIFSENSNYQSGMNFNFLYVTVPSLIVIEIVLAKYAKHKANKHRNNWISVTCLVTFIGSFALTHLIHIWADYTDYQPILVQDSTLPLSYPMTAKSFIAKNDWIVLPAADNETTAREMKYPLSRITVNPHNVRKYNYLIISVKGWNYESLNSKLMPFTDRFSKKTQFFTRHYAANSSSENAMFSFFYGLSPQYFNTASANNISPVLIEELQHEEYHVRTFISNETNDKTILDTSTFSTIRERIPETLNNDLKTANAVVSFLEKLNSVNSANQAPQFIYVSLADPSILKNESGIVRFSPTISNDEGKLLTRKINTKKIEELRNAYANSIYSTDLMIEKIITALEKTSLKNNTIVILAGEFGFELGYNDAWDFGYSGDYTYNKLHVPFMIYDQTETARKYDKLTSHTDLAPTLLEKYLGVTTSYSEYSTGNNLFEKDNPAEFIISGDSSIVYIVENDQITKINNRGNLFVTDSTDHKKTVNIKMPTLLKAMRQLNKFNNN